MKKVLLAALVAMLGLMASSCGGVLHNTPASFVKLEVANFPNGEWDFRGQFADTSWSDKDLRKFTVTGGAGAYTGTNEMITSGLFQFSIVNPGTWNRTWSALSGANEMDGTDGYRNFVVDVPMDGATHVLKIDASTDPATILLDGAKVDNTQKNVFN